MAAVPGVKHGETPGLTEGPYWVDGQLHRYDIRLDTSTQKYTLGVPLYLAFTVSQLADTAPYTTHPLVGARVDIWHANAQGLYSDETSEGTAGMNFSRGFQVTNKQGSVEFLTVYPGWYSGRTPHIHVRIRTFDKSGNVAYDFTSQVFFYDAVTNAVYANHVAYTRSQARDTTNTTDGIFTGSSQNSSPAKNAGTYMYLKLVQLQGQYAGAYHFVIDPSDSANADPTDGTENGFGPGGPGGAPPSGTPPTPPPGTTSN